MFQSYPLSSSADLSCSPNQAGDGDFLKARSHCTFPEHSSCSRQNRSGFNMVEMNSHFHAVSTPHHTHGTAIAVCWTCWRPQYCLLNSTHTQFLKHYSRILQNSSSRTMHVKLCLLNCTSTYRLHTCKICAERM